MRMYGVKSAIAAATVMAAVVLDVGPAVAGGSRLSTVRDRYEAGDLATLVGYTGGPQLAANRDAGPYRAFLADEHGSVRVEVGTFELTDRQTRGWDALRVATWFRIPPATAPGHYVVTYCTGTCDRPAQLGT